MTLSPPRHPSPPARHAGGSSILLALLLAACGGPTVRETGQGAPTAEVPRAEARPVKKLPLVQKRGGGYYKDDGPADEIPENLDDIPDAEPRLEPLHRFANRPYTVLGRSYVPNTSLQPLRQRGVASWYGKKFHGQKTSIGEPYDMFSMTAAHPTLAIPSYVRVTNPASGRSVVVRVTDRGPFHADRIIDLSYAAAHRLGYVNNGSTLVEVEAVLPGESSATALAYAQVKPPEPVLVRTVASTAVAATTAPASVALPADARGVFLQLGAFASADNAESLRSHLARELDWLTEGIQINAGGGMHRVHLGPYPSRAEAEKVAERIRLALGYKPTFLTR